MSTVLQESPSGGTDRRDDYRNGFVDALIYQQGIEQPTEEQIGQAIAILTCYRAQRSVSTAESRSDPRPTLLAAMQQLRSQLRHPDGAV